MSRNPEPDTDAATASLATRYLSAIVQSSDDAIVSKDLNGIITSWNPAAERMFGYSADETVGRSIKMIIPPDRHYEETQVLERIRHGLKVDHFETIRLRKDGSTIEVSLTVSPVRDGSGVIVGASKIARDITERRAAEEAVRQSAALKEQFLTLVSHELRTPIAIIVGNGHLLSRHRGSLEESDLQQALADITGEAERLQRIIENVLLLTRVESGEAIQPEYIQLERLVEQVVASLNRRSPGRRVQVVCEAGLAPVMGEQTLVTSVLENLLSNADKYSPPGEAIEVRVGANEGGEAEVHVLDRGMGFEGGDAGKVFAPFFRAEWAKERASGMGLGLAVCKRAVEEQGGSIGAAQRAGGGADFWFTLPFGPAAPFA